MRGADAVFCALGTTRKVRACSSPRNTAHDSTRMQRPHAPHPAPLRLRLWRPAARIRLAITQNCARVQDAGSAEAFKRVDHDYVVAAAEAAKKAGARYFGLVSAQGEPRQAPALSHGYCGAAGPRPGPAAFGGACESGRAAWALSYHPSARVRFRLSTWPPTRNTKPPARRQRRPVGVRPGATPPPALLKNQGAGEPPLARPARVPRPRLRPQPRASPGPVLRRAPSCLTQHIPALRSPPPESLRRRPRRP